MQLRYMNSFWQFLLNYRFDFLADLNYAKSNITYIDFSTARNGCLSYITEARLKYFSGMVEAADREKRKKYCYSGKPGRVLKKIYPDITDKQLDEVIRKIHSLFAEDNKIIQITDDICHAYFEDNYYDCESGTLGGSCMKYENCQDWFEVYTNNSIEVIILIEKKTGLIAGRALLWPEIFFKVLDSSYKFMDRVYVNNYLDEEIFFQLAKEKGFVYKQYQNYESKKQFKQTFLVDKPECFEDKIKLSINVDGIRNFPFLDTMTYLHKDFKNLTKSCLYNYSPRDKQCLLLDHTDGYVVGVETETILDCVTQCRILIEDSIYLETYSDYIRESDLVIVDGTPFSKHDNIVVFEETTNSYQFRGECVRSSKYGSIFISKAVELVNLYGIHDYTLKEVNGKTLEGIDYVRLTKGKYKGKYVSTDNRDLVKHNGKNGVDYYFNENAEKEFVAIRGTMMPTLRGIPSLQAVRPQPPQQQPQRNHGRLWEIENDE